MYTWYNVVFDTIHFGRVLLYGRTLSLKKYSIPALYLKIADSVAIRSSPFRSDPAVDLSYFRPSDYHGNWPKESHYYIELFVVISVRYILYTDWLDDPYLLVADWLKIL